MLGGGDVAKKLASAGGNILLNKVSEKYGLDMSSPDFDKEAAEAMLADKVCLLYTSPSPRDRG